MEIIEMAKALGKAIGEDIRVKNYNAAKQAYDNDKELIELVSEYNIQKMALNEETKKCENADKSVTDSIQKRLEEIYGKIIASPVMEEYSAAEKQLNDFLNQVNMTISAGINGQEGCSEEQCAHCSHHCHG